MVGRGESLGEAWLLQEDGTPQVAMLMWGPRIAALESSCSPGGADSGYGPETMMTTKKKLALYPAFHLQSPSLLFPQ